MTDQDPITEEYQLIRERATRLAGEPGDIPRRVAVLHTIFLDSNGNHTFPQIALHGALWAARFFSVTGTLGKIISYRYFYSPKEMRFRHGLLTDFSDEFKKVNRSVFIDTYTNYYFTKEHGESAAAAEILPEPLLLGLNKMHQAIKEGKKLSAQQRKDLFQTALQFEQEVTVAPGIKSALGKIDCPILTTLLLKPLVRFRYFRRFRYLLFRNFSDTEERIKKALRTYDIAERTGWPRVVATMKDYGVLPDEFFADPQFFSELQKSNVLPGGTP